MSFGQAIGQVLKNYANFSGRARRSEFWWWALLTFLIGIAFNIVFTAAVGPDVFQNWQDIETIDDLRALSPNAVPLLGAYGALTLFLFLPSLAVAVRRLHDTGKTGWLILLGLIPFLGFIILLVFYVTEGTRGDNAYGPDPKV